MKNKILFAAVCALLAVASVLSVVFITKYNEINGEYGEYKSLSASEIEDLNVKIGILENENGELDRELVDTRTRLDNAEKDNKELEVKLSDSGKYFEDLILEKDNTISDLLDVNAALDKEIKKHRDKENIDITKLTDLVLELEDYIKNDSPLVRVMRTEEEIDELERLDPNEEAADHAWYESTSFVADGKKILGEKYHSLMTLAEILEPTEAAAPEIAVYYKNLSTGFVYTYNADTVFDSASVMKAPYITAVLEACEKYENGEIKPSESDERYTEDKLAEMFDLEAAIVLDHESMDVAGSGVLKDAEDGEEYTFTELIELALTKSDNIAFKQIKNRFTNKWYYEYGLKLGVKSPMTYEMNLSANEAGKLFESIYYFTLQNKKYGTLIRESLTGSAHNVLSANALYGLDVAHKYGWDVDAYNDAAIVYGDNPYVAIVFTNIDCGGTIADEYIRGIFKQVHSMHLLLS